MFQSISSFIITIIIWFKREGPSLNLATSCCIKHFRYFLHFPSTNGEQIPKLNIRYMYLTKTSACQFMEIKRFFLIDLNNVEDIFDLILRFALKHHWRTYFISNFMDFCFINSEITLIKGFIFLKNIALSI